MDSSATGPFDFRMRVATRLASAKTFEERLVARTDVGRECFSSIAKENGLNLIEKDLGLDLAAHPNAVVVGVATYSNNEMEMLNQQLHFLIANTDVFLFDIDQVSNLDDFQGFMPSAGLFRKTPVLAEYSEGQLVRFVEGKNAEARLVDLARNCMHKNHAPET